MTSSDSSSAPHNTERQLLTALTALRDGDFSSRLPDDTEAGRVYNELAGMLSGFGSEVRRVAREVGTEGRFGPQAEVDGTRGEWSAMVTDINTMAANLTNQMRDIASVTTSIATGNLTRKVTVGAEGEMQELKDTINVMVDQMNLFAHEVTRISRECGTEGKFGGQAEVKGVSGTWKDLVDNVNVMSANLTNQVRDISRITHSIVGGDFGRRVTVGAQGETALLKEMINRMAEMLTRFSSETKRIMREVGYEGRLGGQAEVEGVEGEWWSMVKAVNMMAGNVTGQLRDMSQVVKAMAEGDLTRRVTVDAQGEVLSLRDYLNAIHHNLDTLTIETSQVTREIGVEGKLGGQIEVPGASGAWRRLAENLNRMSANLTTQIRLLTEAVEKIEQGAPARSLDIEAQGEMARLSAAVRRLAEKQAAAGS